MSVLKEKLRGNAIVAWLLTRMRTVRSASRLTFGFFAYLINGKTSYQAHQAMISLFCASMGRSNDFFSWMIGKFRRPYQFDRAGKGVAGEIGGEAMKRAVASLKTHGYYVLENKVPADMCDRLLAYATTAPCKVRPMEGEQAGVAVTARYHRTSPQAVRYEFQQQDLLANADVQLLLADLSLAALAQEYLGARPVIDIVALWWNTAFSDQPDAEAAQYFHFDMDRFKWLKFFIYLTDVGPENGPHSFVAGSHRTAAIPTALLDKGYTRLSDNEVESCFDKKDFVEFSAPRGTIIAEDTRGLHKGRNVLDGDRLVLQIEFSNCLFGAYYPKSHLQEDMVPALRERIQRYPDLYAYLEGR